MNPCTRTTVIGGFFYIAGTEQEASQQLEAHDIKIMFFRMVLNFVVFLCHPFVMIDERYKCG